MPEAMGLIERPNGHASERHESSKALEACLTMMRALFDPHLTDAALDAWAPFYEAALLGNGERPRYLASEIDASFKRLIMEWKFKDWPKPAHWLELAAEEARERKMVERDHFERRVTSGGAQRNIGRLYS